MDSRHRRALSPGSHALAQSGRSSTGTFDAYLDDYYGRQPRDYASSRTDKVYPSHASSGHVGAYSGRPRHSAYDREVLDYSPPRQNRMRDEYRPRRERHSIYDDGVVPRSERSGKEREARTRDYAYDEVEVEEADERPRDRRRETRRSHARPRDVEEDEYSYTDAVGMFDDTEPKRQRRRGSVDRGYGQTNREVDDHYGVPERASTRDFHGSSTSRAIDPSHRAFRRHETLDERSLSRNRNLAPDRSNTYDPYDDEDYRLPVRGGRSKPITDPRYSEPSRNKKRDSTEDESLPRRSRGRYKDEAIESRGFGLRPSSTPGSDTGPTEKPPLAIEPPPRRPTVDAYGAEGELLPPDPSDFIPKLPQPDRERRRRADDDDYDDLDARDYEHKARAEPRDKRVESTKTKEPSRHAPTRKSDVDPGYDDYEISSPRRSREHDSHEYADRRIRDDDSDDHDRSRPSKGAIATAAAAAAGIGAIAARGTDEPRRDRATHDGRLKAQRADAFDDYDDDERSSRRARDDRVVQRARRDSEGSIDPRDDPRRLPADSDALRVAERARHDRVDPKNLDRIRGDPDLSASRRASGPEDLSEDDDEPQPKKAGHRDRTRGDLEGSDYDEPLKDARRPRREYDTDSDEEDSAGDEDYRRRVLQSQQELHSFVPPPPPPGAYPAEVSELPNQAALLGADLTAEPMDLAPSEQRSRDKSRVRIVEPPKDEEPAAAVKSILRKPTEKFPDHPSNVREGVKPLKEEATKKGIPTGARWTKIKRSLVNPEALTQAKERFEERLDYVIVLRVLSKDEIQKLADLTAKIRTERDEEYDRQGDGKSSSRRTTDKDLDETDDTDVDDRDVKPRREPGTRDREKSEDKDSSKRHDRERDKERETHRERDKEREKDRERDKYRDRDTGKDRERERTTHHDRDRERDRHRDAPRDRDQERERARK